MAKVDPYIAFRKSLLRDGRVRILSRKTGRSRNEVLGALLHLWILADDFADKKGIFFGWKPEDIDDELEFPGFTKCLPDDWFSVYDGWAQLPKYQQHNGSTAKSRIAEARRKRASRSCPDSVRKTPDKIPTRGEEKRRKEKKKSGSLSFGIDFDKPPAPCPLSVGLDLERKNP